MQGKLNEIDTRSILQLIELGQRTGELFVEAYGSSVITSTANNRNLKDISVSRNISPLEKSWLVFFLNGRIIYAASTEGGITRLRDYLQYYRHANTLGEIDVASVATFSTPEYGYLWTLLENRLLTPAQGKKIIRSMVRETLFDLLSLHQGSFIFEIGSALAPQLTTLEIDPLVTDIMKQVQEWKQLHAYIQSPDQHLSATDILSSETALPANLLNFLEHQPSIRQIARYTIQDVLSVAKIIYPYVQQGLIQVTSLLQKESSDLFVALGENGTNSSLLKEEKIPRIVCIDDGITVRETVELILRKNGYEAAAIGNPVKALSLVFQLKPDLILCDIAMPELDGYEICAMLRRSTTFRQTPIIMLTGKDGFIDRVKARMVGATDYLTKPFGAAELLLLIEKYVGSGDPERPKPDKLLADALKDELEIDIDMEQSLSAPSS